MYIDNKPFSKQTANIFDNKGFHKICRDLTFGTLEIMKRFTNLISYKFKNKCVMHLIYENKHKHACERKDGTE